MDHKELSSAEKLIPLYIEQILAMVGDNEPYGVMGSELFSSLAAFGCDLDTFAVLGDMLISQGILERHGSCYCRSTKLSRTVEMSLCE